jgi:hypothetical protein
LLVSVRMVSAIDHICLTCLTASSYLAARNALNTSRYVHRFQSHIELNQKLWDAQRLPAQIDANGRFGPPRQAHFDAVVRVCRAEVLGAIPVHFLDRWPRCSVRASWVNSTQKLLATIVCTATAV